MADDAKISLLKSILAPRALLSGVLGGFVVCCVLGRIASTRNPYQDFHRFHTGINYLSQFYPTASQLRAIAQRGIDEGRILVIVGGNSVMLGGDQSVTDAWSNQLQLLLGDRFCVLNFAMHGLNTIEVGAIASEIIARDYSKVLSITYVLPAATYNFEPDGQSMASFFWDAYHKGLLDHYPPRDARLEMAAKAKKGDVKFLEMQRRSRSDSILYCQDLWTTFSYRYASSVWCPNYLQGSIVRPRWKYQDVTTSLPVSARYPPARHEIGMAWYRDLLKGGWKPAVAAGTGPDYATSPLARSFVYSCTPQMRQRMLVVVPHFSPRCVSQLTALEQYTLRELYPDAIAAVRAAGCQTVEIGREYTELDFTDFIHISAEGASKMAGDVEPHVREMAERLGYHR